jgi:uncharacterized cupredoxin-like copper-binding protein
MHNQRAPAWVALSPLAILSVVLLALSSCGAPADQATTVRITLSDYKIESSQTTFQAGTIYHFVVTNAPTSTTNHEFMIMAPMSGDTMSMGQMDQHALFRLDASVLPPSATQSFSFAFPRAASPGQLEFACHVGSHYQLGMHESISVTAP